MSQGLLEALLQLATGFSRRHDQGEGSSGMVKRHGYRCIPPPEICSLGGRAWQHASRSSGLWGAGIDRQPQYRRARTTARYSGLRTHNNGVTLTDDGRNWIESVRRYYEGLEEALSRTAVRSRDTDTIRVGRSAPFGREFVVHLVDYFERRYPRLCCTNQLMDVAPQSPDGLIPRLQ